MATVAGDVPGLYDLVVNVSGGNTTGFVFDDALESSLPFRTHKATYTYTPTFIERQNVQGDFGDNQQDFFLTATQRDWSLGEQQRFFRSTDEDSKRRYWQGNNIDVETVVGQATIGKQLETLTAAANVAAISGSGGSGTSDLVYFGTSTNLYEVTPTAVNDKGAHGLGATPDRRGLVFDGNNVFLTTTSAGTVGVRRYNGAAYSTWSATGADSLCFLNNTLYGLRETNGDLIRYDTAGAVTSLFTWKDAIGAADLAIGGGGHPLVVFGGKLAILLNRPGSPWQLWIYDGTAPSIAAEFENGFWANQMVVSNGSIFISGYFRRRSDARAAIVYYASGATGTLWKSKNWTATALPALARWNDGLLWDDPSSGQLVHYDSATGSVSTIASDGTSQSFQAMGSASFVFFAGTGTTMLRFPSGSSTAIASTGTITTSLFDFESSLKKHFRGITVEFDAATDGDGGSVDVYYRLEDMESSYTLLTTGATSGTENTLSGISGKRISVKVQLNKGTSTNGPVLKRIMVRGAPILTRFKQREYILSCIGDPASEDRQILRDGMSSHPLAGRKQADQLVLAAASQTPLTLTDRFGTYTGIIETLEIYEQHANNDDPSASGSFVVKVATREI